MCSEAARLGRDCLRAPCQAQHRGGNRKAEGQLGQQPQHEQNRISESRQPPMTKPRDVLRVLSGKGSGLKSSVEFWL